MGKAEEGGKRSLVGCMRLGDIGSAVLNLEEIQCMDVPLICVMLAIARHGVNHVGRGKAGEALGCSTTRVIVIIDSRGSFVIGLQHSRQR